MEQEYLNLLSQENKNKIDKFIEYHSEKNNNLVLITSGGTTVPLEQNTVRFIDNFSIGTRGSASAEYFLEHSYAVLFIHRRRSLKPYERNLYNVNILEIFKKDTHESNNDIPRYLVDQSLINFDFNNLLSNYDDIKNKNLLLNIEYLTVFEYFAAFEYCCKKINLLKKNALVYLAAAVSDFYIPINEMPKHKIQSNNSGLDIKLKPVPKLVGKLRAEWCPNAFIVTFKLETDPSLLIAKAKNSLEKYKHQCVIGNILEQRKNSVVIIDSNGLNTEINLEADKEKTKNNEIEELIVNCLVLKHLNFKLSVE